MAIIKLSGVDRVYRTNEIETVALENVNLEVEKGEFLSIMGPSGCGKSTLLNIIGLLDTPTKGTVEINGTLTGSMTDSALSHFRNTNIGFVFQFHQLLPEFTACENVALPAMIGGMSKKKAMQKASGLLDMLGLSERKNHKPAEMSGGERQRAAIARAMINDPEVIFADEPTGSLDSRNRDEIRNVIADLRDRLGQTFVIVTHDLSMTSIADRVISMADGHIIAEEEIHQGFPQLKNNC